MGGKGREGRERERAGKEGEREGEEGRGRKRWEEMGRKGREGEEGDGEGGERVRRRRKRQEGGEGRTQHYISDKWCTQLNLVENTLRYNRDWLTGCSCSVCAHCFFSLEVVRATCLSLHLLICHILPCTKLVSSPDQINFTVSCRLAAK